jgi:hypothetical protein
MVKNTIFILFKILFYQFYFPQCSYMRGRERGNRERESHWNVKTAKQAYITSLGMQMALSAYKLKGIYSWYWRNRPFKKWKDL